MLSTEQGDVTIESSFVQKDIDMVGGTITSPTLGFSADQTRSGSGTINGSLTIAGVVSPGHSLGVIWISGDNTQTGELVIEIGNVNTDLVFVGGTASLHGTLRILLLDDARFEEGQSFNYLQAGSILGQFNTILMPEAANGAPLFALGTSANQLTLIRITSESRA
jgi:hypothetical protein